MLNIVDPANSQRRVVITNRRLLFYDGSSQLAAAVDTARRIMGTKLPKGSLALPLSELKRMEIRTNKLNLPVVESLLVELEYHDPQRRLQSLSFTIYPADKKPLLKAMKQIRPDLELIDGLAREQLERVAQAGGSVSVQNIQGDVVQEKVNMKIEDRRTQITDSVVSRSSVGEMQSSDINRERPPELDRPSRLSYPEAALGHESPGRSDTKNKVCQICGATMKGEWHRCPYCEN